MKYAVTITLFFYDQPNISTRVIKVMATLAEAIRESTRMQAICDSRPYHLMHGEYGRPEFRAIRIGEASGK